MSGTIVTGNLYARRDEYVEVVVEGAEGTLTVTGHSRESRGVVKGHQVE